MKAIRTMATTNTLTNPTRGKRAVMKKKRMKRRDLTTSMRICRQ